MTEIETLLWTKIAVPITRTALIARPRLYEALDQALLHPLTLICAPAGAGKTTVITSWRQSHEHDGVALAWLSLDEEDNELVQFTTYFAAALERVHPGILQQIAPLSSLPQTPPVRVLATTLINAMLNFPHDVVLVLDDYHRIANRSIHEFVAFVVEHMPSHMHIMMTTREDPPLPLARLRAHGSLVEIREADLRFAQEEAGRFLQKVFGLSLTNAQIAALDKRIEGWLTGLKLAALAMQGRADIDTFVNAFSGSHQYVVDYLLEEVFENQPADVQQFLLNTVIVPQMNADLCAAITGLDPNEAQNALEYLVSANLFVVALDDRGEWFRYHHLFAEVLLKHRRRALNGAGVEGYRRAGDWFAAHGWLNDAMNAWLKGGEHDRAAAYLAEHAFELVERDGYATVLYWLNSGTFDDATLQRHPLLLIFYITMLNVRSSGRLVSLRHLPELDRLLLLLSEAVRRLPPDHPHAPVVRALSQGLHAAQLIQDDLPQAIALTREAASVLRDQSMYWFALTSIQLGMLHLLAHQFDEAREQFRRVRDLSMQHRITEQFARASLELSLLEVNMGHIAASTETALDALHTLRSWKRDHYPSAAFLHMTLCTNALLCVRLDEAETHGRQFLHLVEHVGLETFKEIALRCVLDTAYLRGETREVEDYLARLEALDPMMLGSRASIAAATAGLYHSRLGNVRQANTCLDPLKHRLHDGYEDVVTVFHQQQSILVYTSLVEAYMLQLDRGEPLDVTWAELLSLLRDLLHFCEAFGMRLGHLKVLTLAALACEGVGDSDAADDMLQQVMRLAADESIMLYFVEVGDLMTRLLRRFTPPEGTEAFASRLLAHLTRPREVSIGVSAAAGELEPLTEREREVFSLVADGYSNREIAEKLYLSLGTVKKHIANIFLKLGAESRTHALAIAREHHLIE